MKKIILLLTFLLSIGCSKQDAQNSFSVDPSSSQIFIKQKVNDDNKAASISYEELVEVTHKALSNIKQHQKNPEGVTQFIPSKMNSKFEPFQTWMSIKITTPQDYSSSWGTFIAEVYDAESYEESKFMSFQACKEVWKNIDDRVPLVIDELSQKISDYESRSSKAQTQQIRFGYWINLDASHYAEGYPVVCQIAISK